MLVAGGWSGIQLNSAELYDPSLSLWITPRNMNTTRQHHTATLLTNGKVLVSGGWNGGFINSAELYDPLSDLWTTTGTMGTGRGYHTATLLTMEKC